MEVRNIGIVSVAIVLVGIVSFLSRSILKPINTLREIMDKIRGGELESEIDPMLKKSKDEIGKLANTFDDMRQSIKKSNQEIPNIKKILDEFALISITDKNGTITYANDMFCKVSKYSKEELLGQNHRILKSGYHPPEFYEDLRKTISSGKIWKNDIKNMAKDGSFYWVKTTIIPILDNKGKPEQYTSIRVDITKQKELEKNLILMVQDKTRKLEQINEELIQSESKFKNLYHSSPDMFRTINTDGVILNCNDVYAKKLGYSRDEVIGESIFNHVTKDSLDAMHKSFEAWKDGAIPINHKVQMRRKNGTSFPAFVKASNLYDKDRKLIGSNTAIRDVSEIYHVKRKYEEEKMKRLAAIGELASRLAHDLRNPLSVIKNTFELIRIGTNEKDDENIKKRYDRIDRAVSRMSNQIENVLDFVKEKPLNLKQSSFFEVCSFVMERIKVPPEVKINLPKDNVKIICDPEQLEIVFINLITNAIQAMENRGEINVRVTEENSSVIIEVADSGPGIPKELIPKIFDPLFTTRQIGTGLGLPSCKTIVEKHHGKIKVESTIGKGTTFKIKLPKKIKNLN